MAQFKTQNFTFFTPRTVILSENKGNAVFAQKAVTLQTKIKQNSNA